MNQSISINGAVSGASSPTVAPIPQPFTPRLIIGMIGVLAASLCSGLNDRVTDIALADVQGALSISSDQGSWLIGSYQAAEVAAMLIAPWLAMTFSIRRFAMAMTAGFVFIALIIPFAPNLPTFIALRVVQGAFGGALPPLLMTVALRFLPPHFKLYGLSAYALTATFGPNIATSLAAIWTDYVGWQYVFWQIVPPCVLAIFLIGYGLPQDPLRLERFKNIDAVGMLTGCSGLALMVLTLQQGERLDWFNSPLITSMFFASLALLTLFAANEWYHPLPLFKLQMLRRNNLAHGLLTLFGLMLLFLSGSAIPSGYMAQVEGFRAVQFGPLALSVGLPQLLLAPLVAAILNIRWVDSRWILTCGLALLAVSCYLGSQLTSDWSRDNFYIIQAMQAFGQPMAVMPILMGATSVVQPMEGPFASAMFNVTRGMGSIFAGAMMGTFLSHRQQQHSNILLNHVGSNSYLLSQPYDGLGSHLAPLNPDGSAVSTEMMQQFAGQVRQQTQVLALSDTYLAFIAVAALLALLTFVVARRTYPPQSIIKQS